MPSPTLDLKHDGEKSRKILNELRVRVRESQRILQDKHKEWREAEERTLAFLPERDIDASRRETREGGGKPQYTTIQIPYSYAVLMAAHTYITTVFLARTPIHQFTGRHGESMQNVQALEAVIDYQTLVGGFLPPYYTWIHDALKYGIGCLGVFWEDRFEHISQIQETPTVDILGQETGGSTKERITMRARSYSGNRVYNIQPWDFLWDTRYPAKLFQQGEYLAIRFSLGWNVMKRREAAGFYMNLDKLGRTQPSTFDSSQSAGSDQLDRPETTDPSAAQSEFSELSPKHPALVNGYEVYVDLIPKEWGLGTMDFPEKWVFTTSGDFKVLIGAQPLGAIHNEFPASVLPLEPEGYGLTTRGLAKTLAPIQNTIDWLINTHFYNVRASLNNQLIVDPSRTVMKDWLNPSAGKIIRLKPEAYGQDTRLAWSQVAIADVTQNHLRDLQMMLGLGERTVGINDQIMGAVNTGGRKTATEVRTSTTFGVNRLKTISEWFSAVGFAPLAKILVQNTQQYYDQEQKFKIAGDLVASTSPSFMDVNPDMLSGFYDFVPVDGTLPIDRFAQANLWRELLGQVVRMPQIAMRYDLGAIFEFVAQLAGLKNITRFKIELTPDQEMQAQVAAGNSVPLNGAGGTPQSSTSPNPPSQIGTGTTG